MAALHFKNFALLEPDHGELRQGYELLVEGETIRELSEKPIKAENAGVIDCGGRTLMPGLIDSHVHVFLSEVYIRALENMPLTLMTARAIGLMKGMIDRGFTSVRDTGGADWGIKEAVETGHCRSAPLVHRRPGDRPDGRPQRPAPAHRFRRTLPLLQRDGLYDERLRRRFLRAQIGARADAARRRSHQDHDVGRRRLSLRPAQELAPVQPR